jgi:hypothetical protein
MFYYTDVDSEIYDDITLERFISANFGLNFDIEKVIVRAVPVSYTTEATVFLAPKNQLFVLVSGQSRLLLRDIQTILSNMGLKAEKYLPPKNQPDYFTDIGTKKFKEVFPGRASATDQDIRFYKTLAPYNPALAQISEVRTGVIKQFDTDSSGSWRPAAKFSYRRIKAS